MVTEVLDCGHVPSPHDANTTGYGVTPGGLAMCWDCCARLDESTMDTNGRIALYLHEREVTNWPGSLKFRVVEKRKSRHNIAGVRYDVWFHDRHGKTWHGVQYGNNTQVVRCRRLKS